MTKARKPPSDRRCGACECRVRLTWPTRPSKTKPVPLGFRCAECREVFCIRCAGMHFGWAEAKIEKAERRARWAGR